AMDFQEIIYEKRDGAAYITLNRPEEANALTLQTVRELHRAAIDCDQDRAVRAVLITGKGKMFCAGGDLKFFLSQGDGLAVTLAQMTSHFHGAIATFNRMDAPVVCAVNGTAAGGGLSFAISNDIVIAAQSAKFTMAYTAAALSPDGSSSWFLPRLIGLRRAKELTLTNRVLSAAEAREYGLIDRVVADDVLAAEAEAQVRAFADGPTRAYGAVKRLFAASYETGMEVQMELESRSIATLAPARDGQEGMTAFAAKRKPVFRGE
ncbi:MAG TPA: enoyl-CoA hydratase-related protein, partial [Alphaproteobacteria bacterium]|nr:enoyl-CoA hydratase-related protein [Alphaproteobacteria bacterium]